MQGPYRRDIDGLRAIAVSAVVLYHFGLPGIPGGFVGVDIFFVLSGFLIGGILWREQEATGTIDLFAFYTRRIRRLAPAYVAMAAATAIAAWFVLLPFEFREFGKQLIAATVYLSNVFFWREAGYFDAASDEKPLLHTWSLSVEEQFYIVLPILLIMLYRIMPRLRIATLWLATIASLIACVLVTPNDSVSTFFLFHFRAWELLAGVLLAIYMTKGWQAPQSFACSLAGLSLIIFALTQITAGAAFPGWQAIVPVLGTLLMLAGGLQQHIITRALSWTLPVAIGLISYSLYLWHWPVYVLSHYARGGYAGTLEIAAWVGLSVLLAALSWKFVEQPFRKSGPNPKQMVSLAVASSICILAFGGWLFKSDGMPERFDAETRPHIAASADFLQDFSRCYVPADGPLESIEICPIGPDGAPEVLVWGDSHLRAFADGVSLAALDADRPGLLVWHAGCPPLYGIKKDESYATPSEDAACSAANKKMETAINELKPKSILLIGRWNYYATGQGIGRDEQNTITITPTFQEAVNNTLNGMSATDTKVHVMRQVPEVPTYDSRTFARALAHSRALPGRSTVALEQATQRDAFGSAPFLNRTDINWIDTWGPFCSESDCSALPDGQPYYFDNNHITNTAARALGHLVKPVFQK